GLFQRRLAQLRSGRGITRRPDRDARGVPRAAESEFVRRDRASGARRARQLEVHGRDDRVWGHVHRHPAHHERHDLLAALLQVPGKPGRPLIAAVVAILVCGGISVSLQALRDDMVLATTDDEALYLTERATSRAVFTHRALAADLYWIRAV